MQKRLSIIIASCLVVGLVIIGVPSEVRAVAPLAPSGQLFNPDTGLGSFYTLGSPAWAVAGSLADTLTAPMTGEFTGSAISNVYYVNGVDGTGGLGFTYQFFVTAPPDAGMVRASFADDWGGVAFLDTGSDESGSTTAASGATTWTDGDPHYIERTPTGAPAIQWRFGANGTQLDDGDFSAVVWWQTDAQDWSVSHTGLLDSGLVGQVAIFAVPVPGAVVLGALGLGLVGWMRRRFS